MSSNHRSAVVTVATSLAAVLAAGGCAAESAPVDLTVVGSAGAGGPAADPPRPATFTPLGGNPDAAVEVLGGDLRPGAPTVERQLHDGVLVTLTLSPARPGWNLVRVDASTQHGERGHGEGHHEDHEEALLVGTDPDHLVAARPRPGADGSWARLRLPAGASLVYVAHGPEHRLPFPVGTGSAEDTVPSPGATGPDAPECAAAAVGGLLAGRTPGATTGLPCPSDELAAEDAAALRGTVDVLADRGAEALALLSDRSPRSTAAADAVRTEARSRHLRVVAADRAPARTAFVSVAGWTTTARSLAGSARAQQRQVRYEHGVWLAPWLLSPGVVDSTPGAVLPLGFDVRAADAVAYRTTLDRVLPGTAPTASGFAGWQGTRTREPAALYAASRASAMSTAPSAGHGTSHETTVSWFPGGTVTRVSGPLT